MRVSLLLICLLSTFISACGSMTTKDTASLSSEPAFLTENSEDLYMIESQQKKKVYFLFFDENDELISKSNSPFPVGAFEAKLYVDDPTQLTNATFTTCCGKTLEINVTEEDGSGIIALKEFSLGNAKHKLSLYFADEDIAVLSQEVL
ncbi:MAG: hypothetical protein AB8G05_18750 [Oligoflexales bacterium]